MSAKLADQNAEVLKSNADIQLELRQLRDQIQALQSNLDATNQRLGSLSAELAATRDKLAASEPVPAPAAQTAVPGAATGRRTARQAGRRGPGARAAVQRRVRGLPARQLRPRDPGFLRIRQALPDDRPRRQRALLDRRVLLLEEAVQGGDRRLHPADQHLQDVRQGGRRAAQEGARLSRARRPLPGGHQPAVRSLRTPGHQGGGARTLPPGCPRGQGEVSRKDSREISWQRGSSQG